MADYKKPDYWQQKARSEGYPARSVYKLMELEKKFPLFKPCAGKANGLRVLDLGAAPGSWSLYLLREFAGRRQADKTFLCAADLSPLSREFDKGLFDNDNFFFIQGDIMAAEILEAICAKGPYSVIISDAAPGTTGSHVVDAARSGELAQTVVAYAENALAKGGNLVLKIFQGDGSEDVLKRIKALFTTAKSFKPQACRGESVETYFAGLGKK